MEVETNEAWVSIESASFSIRYSFTAQFLVGAAFFANRAFEIESYSIDKVGEEEQTLHRAFVVSTVVQSWASIESLASEVFLYGPRQHLGSDQTNQEEVEFLKPIEKILEQVKPLERLLAVLHVLRHPSIDRGGKIFENADLLRMLRNGLVHYESLWNREDKLVKRLKILNFRKPPFCSQNSEFFPHKCLSASLASWAVMSARTLIDEFYRNLKIKSSLEPYAERLKVHNPIKDGS